VQVLLPNFKVLEIVRKVVRRNAQLVQQFQLVDYTRARVAELADALDSGSSVRKDVEVRVLSRAPSFFL
jgi:hypothetical protein